MKNSPLTCILSERECGPQNVTRRGDGHEQALYCSKQELEVVIVVGFKTHIGYGLDKCGYGYGLVGLP